jgi:hypothetical protein
VYDAGDAGPIDPDIQRLLRKLVQDLADAKYDDIAADGRGGRLTPVELHSLIHNYGRTLITLPDEAWSLVDVYLIAGQPDVVAMDIPLWTKEEGRSDLTLSVTITRSHEVLVQIDDIHVL